MSDKLNIEELARQAGGTVMQPYDYGAKPDRMILSFDSLERFAALVKAEVLEQAACDISAFKTDCSKRCAEGIRAMKPTQGE